MIRLIFAWCAKKWAKQILNHRGTQRHHADLRIGTCESVHWATIATPWRPHFCILQMHCGALETTHSIQSLWRRVCYRQAALTFNAEDVLYKWLSLHMWLFCYFCNWSNWSLDIPLVFYHCSFLLHLTLITLSAMPWTPQEAEYDGLERKNMSCLFKSITSPACLVFPWQHLIGIEYIGSLWTGVYCMGLALILALVYWC